MDIMLQPVSSSSSTKEYPQESNYSYNPPLPNPPFVFPARPRSLVASTHSTASTPDSSTAATAQSDRASTYTMGPSNAAKKKPPALLPNFSFYPSTSENLQVDNSGIPSSPTAARPISSRAGGHRRSGSEFIGGDGKTGTLGLMSSSPTKGEGALPSPRTTGMKSGPPRGARHSHKRSGAISCHDLSVILKPANPTATMPRGASAPNSPSDVIPAPYHGHDPMPTINTYSPTKTGKAARARQELGAPRARVGFSDTLEFIPRPLSSLSSDTSSTTQTLRGNHSLSTSISSTASFSVSTSPPSKDGQSVPKTTREGEQLVPRPNTAGPTMIGHDHPNLLEPDSSTPKRPSSASGLSHDARSLNAKKLCPLDVQLPKSNQSSTLPSPSDMSANSLEASPAQRGPSSTGAFSSVAHSNHPSTKIMPSIERKPSKKHKKVKIWAGSFLSRKDRHGSQKQKALLRRSPTPPIRTPSPAKIETLDFDMMDDSYTIVDPSLVFARQPPSPFTAQSSGSPASFHSNRDEPMSPIIDLDAALGPFNTPSLDQEFKNASHGSFSAAKRRMHSSGTTGGFAGPGMHYHRRAESAPELVPVDFRMFGIHRLGSSQTMADVFEEDEEEEDELPRASIIPEKMASKPEVSAVPDMGIGIALGSDVSGKLDFSKLGPSASTSDDDITPTDELRPNVSADSSELDKLLKAPSSNKDATTSNTAENEVNARLTTNLRSLEASFPPSLQADIPKDGHLTADLVLQNPTPAFLSPETPSSLTSSAFPSPDFSSFEVPRSITTASSFNDEYPMNMLLGEPGPEFRMSTEDVPSLAGSNSTMASGPVGLDHLRHNNSTFFEDGNQPSPNATISGSRASTCEKRASLVSLTRLVRSSHGEKSKLSIEERAQPDSPDSPTKEKRAKRISRMMYFWKPKDKNMD
ncbi:MAG: hypothetical protein M1829_003584 [Trizodia sp. TS-e1964]|nr:MAG: hypothetical protein M1829_003584 [Trizodia sp. TS-e1964]